MATKYWMFTVDYAENRCKVQPTICAQNFCTSISWIHARKIQTRSGFWDRVCLKKILVFCYWSIIIIILNGTRLGLLWSYKTEMNDPTCPVSAPEADQCPLAQRDALIDLDSAPCNRSPKHFEMLFSPFELGLKKYNTGFSFLFLNYCL